MSHEGYRVTYRELITFFLPVAAMTMIMMSSHNVISSALAQTAAPALALAAYSVGQSVSQTLQAPCWALVKLTTATADNKASLATLLKVAWQTGFFVFGIMLLIAFTPLNRLIFINLMGVTAELFEETLQAFRIFLIMPFFGIIRSTHQGFVVLRRKTIWLTNGTLIRIGSMFIAAFVLTKTQWVTGGKVGSVILLIGFCMEAVVAFIKGRPWLKNAPEPIEEKQSNFTVGSMWIFFVPLVLAQVINSFVNPGVSAGLARTADPEVAISTYFVARSLAWIFLGMGFRVHQIVLVFVKDQASWLTVRKFVFILSGMMATFLAVLSFTPVGAWVYAHIIHVDYQLASGALKALAFFVIVPPFMFVAELYQGLILQARRSKEITICKTINVITLFIVLFSLVAVYPQLGCIIGGISMAASYLVEAIVSYFLCRKYAYSSVKQLDTIAEIG